MTWTLTRAKSFGFDARRAAYCLAIWVPWSSGGPFGSRFVTTRRPLSATSGARMAVYQPPPGQSSTTVMSSRSPKNSSVSSGKPPLSRAVSTAGRSPDAIAARSFAAVLASAGGDAEGPGSPAGRSAEGLRPRTHSSTGGRARRKPGAKAEGTRGAHYAQPPSLRTSQAPAFMVPVELPARLRRAAWELAALGSSPPLRGRRPWELAALARSPPLGASAALAPFARSLRLVGRSLTAVVARSMRREARSTASP